MPEYLVIDLVDKIESMFDKKPDGRKKKEFAIWKKEINPVIDELNKIKKMKIYNKQ